MMALRLLPILVLLALQQDDFATWIDQLGHESIEVRDGAIRNLRGLELSDIPRLEKAREVATDAEVRARIVSIIDHIRKSAELAKVFSPTRRYTKSGKGLKLTDVVGELGALVGDKFTFEPGDDDRIVDLDLDSVTWWEALDRTMEAAGVRYWFTGGNGKTPKLQWAAQRSAAMPVVYFEQFRVRIHDTRRFDYREPGERTDAGLITIQVWHQPDLKPERSGMREGIVIDSVKDAKGEDAVKDTPPWNPGMMWTPGRVSADLAHNSIVWVRADAAPPLEIKGTARLSFAKNTQETVIDLAGDKREIAKGAVTLSVVSFTHSKAASRVKLRATSKEPGQDLHRIVNDSVLIEDDGGRRHRGGGHSSTRSRDYAEWEFDFPAEIQEPKRVVFTWIGEYHTVEIPFRFDGVRLP